MRVVRDDGTVASILAPQQHFEGTTRIESIPLAAVSPDLWLFRQRSKAGARSAWHSHPGGQVLYVVEGEGRVQMRGGEVVVVREGDIVEIGPDEWHWHGASDTTSMTHIAYQTGDRYEIAWGERVD